MNNRLNEPTKSLAQSVTRRAQHFINNCCQRRVRRLTLAGTAIALGLVGAQRAPAAFTATGSMSHPRVGHTATLLPNGKILVAGGEDETNILSTAELYNPATGTWEATGPLASARFDHTATLLGNGLVLVAGGSTNGSVGQVGAELYDPANGSWMATSALINARGGHTATLLTDGRVLIAGGYGSASASAELYDPVARTWTAVGEMAAGFRTGHAATLLPNGQVLVSSGISAELYDPVTRLWTKTGDLNEVRLGHTATLLPNGQVLVTGGATSSPIGLPVVKGTTELYDPVAGTWTKTGSMVFSNSIFGRLEGRFYHTATLLPNGLVLAAGGWGNSFFSELSTTEFYNPETGTWSAAGEMMTGRAQHTATMLPNGQVLMAGGDSPVPPSNLKYATAELYWTGTIAVTPPTLRDARKLPNGSFQFGLTNTVGAGFSVLASTNPAALLSDWTLLGGLVETSPGRFQFTDSQATNYPTRFYRVRSP